MKLLVALLALSLPLAANMNEAVYLFQGEYRLYVNLYSRNTALVLPLPPDDIRAMCNGVDVAYAVVRLEDPDPFQGMQPKVRIRVMAGQSTVYASDWLTAVAGTHEVPLECRRLLHALREHGSLTLAVELDASWRPSYRDRGYGVTVSMVALAPATMGETSTATANTATAQPLTYGQAGERGSNNYTFYVAVGAGALALAALIVAAARR